MNILITGGYGFVGARLAYHYLSLGHVVFISSRQSLVSCKYSMLLSSQHIILDWHSLDSLVSSLPLNIDLIIHCAGLNASLCSKSPDFASSFNTLKTGLLLSAASSLNVKRFIYLSTTHVYSGSPSGLINEKSSVHNTHPYPLSKYNAEKLLSTASLSGDIDCVSVRLSNAFGAPVAYSSSCWELFVNNICKQATQSDLLCIISNPYQYRDFVPFSYLVSFFDVLLALPDFTIFRDTNYVVNLSSGNSRSLLEMASLIKNIYASTFLIDLPISYDANHRIPDKAIFDSLYSRLFPVCFNELIELEIQDLINFTARHFS